MIYLEKYLFFVDWLTDYFFVKTVIFCLFIFIVKNSTFDDIFGKIPLFC